MCRVTHPPSAAGSARILTTAIAVALVVGGCGTQQQEKVTVDPTVSLPTESVSAPPGVTLTEPGTELKGGVDKRTVLRLDPRLAPVKAAVLPLSRNADLSPVARDLAPTLRKHWNVEFDDAGAIGRRYRRQDEIGTPFCLTVDFDTLNDQAVTVRERDSMTQERVALDQVEGYLAARLVGC